MSATIKEDTRFAIYVHRTLYQISNDQAEAFRIMKSHLSRGYPVVVKLLGPRGKAKWQLPGPN